MAASRQTGVDSTLGGSDVLLFAVGAAVIGGTSLFGGRGRVLDAILGGAVIAVISNGMDALNLAAGIKFIVTGLVLLAAATVDALSDDGGGTGVAHAVPPDRRRRLDDMRAGPSQEDIRRQNLGALLRLVHVGGAASRAELTTKLGLNRSTIGALTTDLVSAGLVREELPERSRSGRASVARGSARVAAGLRVRVHDQRGPARRRPDRSRRRDPRSARDRPRPGRRVARPRRSRRSPRSSSRCSAVRPPTRSASAAAWRSAAWCDARTAWCASARTSAGSTNRSGARARRASSPAPAASRSATRPTWPRSPNTSAARPCDTDNVIYLHGDVGIGGGIIAGGRLVAGHGGYGGEVGHIVVNPNGRPCSCGSRGCWETEIGEHALLRAADRSGTGRDGILAVVDAAQRGDARAQEAVRQVAEWLGFGVANLVNIFNPDTVIFGGTLRDVYLAGADRGAQPHQPQRAAGLPGAPAPAYAGARRRRPADRRRGARVQPSARRSRWLVDGADAGRPQLFAIIPAGGDQRDRCRARNANAFG